MIAAPGQIRHVDAEFPRGVTQLNETITYRKVVRQVNPNPALVPGQAYYFLEVVTRDVGWVPPGFIEGTKTVIETDPPTLQFFLEFGTQITEDVLPDDALWLGPIEEHLHRLESKETLVPDRPEVDLLLQLTALNVDGVRFQIRILAEDGQEPQLVHSTLKMFDFFRFSGLPQGEINHPVLGHIQIPWEDLEGNQTGEIYQAEVGFLSVEARDRAIRARLVE